MPEGNTLEFKVEENDPLSLIYVGIMEQTGESNFLLSVPFPRRIFQPSELDLTTIKAAGF